MNQGGSLISGRMVVGALVLIGLLWWVSRGVLPTTPTTSAALASEVIATRYINGAVDCPMSPEFGEIVAPQVNVWAEPDSIEKIGELSHGAKIDVLRGGETGWYRIGYGSRVGWVQSVMVVDYDPTTEEIRPNEADCL